MPNPNRFPFPGLFSHLSLAPCTFGFLGLMFPESPVFFLFYFWRLVSFVFWGILGTRCIFTASSWPVATGYPGRCNSLRVEFRARKKCVIHVSAGVKHLAAGELQGAFEEDFNCVFM